MVRSMSVLRSMSASTHSMTARRRVVTCSTTHSTAAHGNTPRVPQWVLLGFDASLARGAAPVRHEVHDSKLVVYRTKDERELRVALDACPHRGASLSGGSVKGQCVVCPYHARSIGVRATPDRFFDYAVQDGLVWLDWTSRKAPTALASTVHRGPPAYPEHSDPDLRTFEYTKILSVNPVLMTENTLDWQHLAHVHRVHFIEGNPVVTIRSKGEHGWAEYAYESELFDLTIDNEYHVPFTTSLRFRFRNKKTGESLPPLLLWFSVCPLADGQVALNLRVTRGVLRHPLADWLFRLIDELPLLEDATIVAGVDAKEWACNRLDAGDEFVAAYRTAMETDFPDLLDKYVRGGEACER